jgi:hypothetical protein
LPALRYYAIGYIADATLLRYWLTAIGRRHIGITAHDRHRGWLLLVLLLRYFAITLYVIKAAITHIATLLAANATLRYATLLAAIAAIIAIGCHWPLPAATLLRDWCQDAIDYAMAKHWLLLRWAFKMPLFITLLLLRYYVIIATILCC